MGWEDWTFNVKEVLEEDRRIANFLGRHLLKEEAMPEKTEERNIGGRDPGDVALKCVQCNRLWGKDDLLDPKGIANATPKGSVDAVGLCPWCKDHRESAGLVYPNDTTPDEVA